MIYLYVKTHNKTGLKYLGQTTSKDPYKYTGSGLYWKLHLKKHGKDITTVILKECLTKREVRYWGEYYNDLWNVVESDDWANLKEETGDGGSIKGINLGRKHSKEIRKKISESKKGKPINRTHPVSEETKRKLSKIFKGTKRKRSSVIKQMETRTKNGTRWHTEETKRKMRKPKSEQARENMRKANHPGSKGGCWITNGKTTKFSKNSEVPKGWWKGRIVKTPPPSQKGKYWVTNGTENKMVFEIPEGWRRGRTKKKKE